MRPPSPYIEFSPTPSARESTARTIIPLIALAAVVSLVFWFVLRMIGLANLALATGVLAFGIVFTIASFRHLIVPVLIWLIFLMGFRNLLMLHTQGLPDISPDRALLVWIFSLFLLKVAMGERPRARWHLLDSLLIVHLGYLLASIYIHESAGLNSWTRCYLMGYGAYFVGKYIIDGRWTLIRVIVGLLFVLNIYYGVVAIAEYYGIQPLIWPKMILDQSVYDRWPGRSHGVFLQPAVYGIVMGMLLTLQVYYLRATRNPVLRLLLYISLPLVMAGLYFTYTRGSWLVGIFGLVTMGLVGWRQYGRLVGRMVVVAVLLLAAGLLNPQQDKRFVERIGTENTITARLNVAARAYRIFLDHPIFGCGYFRYNSIKREYQGTLEVPIYGVIRRAHDIDASIHDMYLGILAEEGLVGIGLQLAIYLQVLVIFRRKYLLRHQGDPFAVNLMPAIAGLMVGYAVGGVSIDYRYFTALLALFFLMVGILAGYRPAEDAAAETVSVQRLRLVGQPKAAPDP